VSAAGPARAFLSIGEVLAQLRPEFADVTISKIRFLESEGLIRPERTPSGYRKFSRTDVARLRYVLAQQRDHYLPLRVIKENLDAIDRGLEPAGTGGGPARPPRTLWTTEGMPRAGDFARDSGEIRLSREELLAETGLDSTQLVQLEQFGLLAVRPGGYYDSEALVVARTVADMSRFGIEPRHLRAFRTAADREIGLFQQVVAPIVRQRGPEARARAAETVRELAALSVRLHATLVKSGLRSEMGG
jgi:Predicted transcriptional regulators